MQKIKGLTYKIFSSLIFSAWLFLAIFTFAITGAAAERSAKESAKNTFFEKDAARSVFEEDVTLKDQSEIQILNPVNKKQEKGELQKQPAKEDNQKQEPAINNDIIGKYGDPAKDAPVLAQDNAPEPFKGMLAALDAGDRKLAFQYARQYVRYIHKLDQTTKDAMAFQILAMEKEGIISQDGYAKNDYLEERIELKNELKEKTEKKIATERVNLANLDPAVKEFLNQAVKAESEEVNPAVNTEPAENKINTEEQLRMQARAQLAGKVPVDPKGQADIYFFINTKNQSSIEMGKEFEKFYTKFSGNQNLRIACLTLDKEDGGEVSVYRRKTGAKYPIQNGSVFSKQIGVGSAPAIAVVARNSGQAVIEEGFRSAVYLEELFKIIAGGK